MSRSALPLLGIVLSISAMVVSFVAGPAEQPETAAVAPRLTHVGQTVRTGEQFITGESSFVVQVSERIDRADEVAQGLENAVQPPSDQELRARAGDVIEANWPVFIQRYLYASGRIGVLSAAEQRTASALGRRQGDELRRLGLNPEQQKKAEPVVGEVIVLVSKARNMLKKWPKALEIERERIFEQAHRKLRGFVPSRQADAIRKWMGGRFK